MVGGDKWRCPGDALYHRSAGNPGGRPRKPLPVSRPNGRRWAIPGGPFWTAPAPPWSAPAACSISSAIPTIRWSWDGRLHPDHWGKGLASEAARRMAGFAFDQLGTASLLANAMPENLASRRVMERLGMRFRGIEHWWKLDLATYENHQGRVAGLVLGAHSDRTSDRNRLTSLFSTSACCSKAVAA